MGRRLGHRFVVWGNGNPFLMAVIFDLVIVVVFAFSLQRQTDANVERAKHEARERATALVEATVESCKHVVTVLTERSKADDLALIQGVVERFAEQGRPIPAVYVNLELVITNRQPPTAACEPKENP